MSTIGGSQLHPKVHMFLRERDRAYARQDVGVIRSMNVELRRLGIPDTGTLADPSGKRSRSRKQSQEVPTTTEAESRSPGRPKLPRCEHENVADRCLECNPELAAS